MLGYKSPSALLGLSKLLLLATPVLEQLGPRGWSEWGWMGRVLVRFFYQLVRAGLFYQSKHVYVYVQQNVMSSSGGFILTYFLSTLLILFYIATDVGNHYEEAGVILGTTLVSK